MSKLDKAVSKDIENYDKSKLGKVEAKDGATPAQSRDMVMAGESVYRDTPGETWIKVSL